MCKPKTPAVPLPPPLPPERAPERAPTRNAVAPEARRQVEATYGKRSAPSPLMRPPPRVGAGFGLVRGTSSAQTAPMTSILGG